jgi:hypothetical protein
MRYLRYIGSDQVLGEIVKDGGFYWLVNPGPDKKNKTYDINKVACHPKWCTEVIEENSL